MNIFMYAFFFLYHLKSATNFIQKTSVTN